MTRRTTFFVESASWRDHALHVSGEVGLGPLCVGDVVDGYVSQDGGAAMTSRFLVLAWDGSLLVLSGEPSRRPEAGDILHGEQVS